MIYGIGIDVVDLERFNNLFFKWGNKLEQRIMAANEIAKLPQDPQKRIRRIALAFAAKESFVKALQTGFNNQVSLQQILITRNENGAPNFSFSCKLSEHLKKINIKSSHLSLSDDKNIATAITILEV